VFIAAVIVGIYLFLTTDALRMFADWVSAGFAPKP
jgi:hypothetical protein